MAACTSIGIDPRLEGREGRGDRSGRKLRRHRLAECISGIYRTSRRAGHDCVQREAPGHATSIDAHPVRVDDARPAARLRHRRSVVILILPLLHLEGVLRPQAVLPLLVAYVLLGPPARLVLLPVAGYDLLESLAEVRVADDRRPEGEEEHRDRERGEDGERLARRLVPEELARLEEPEQLEDEVCQPADLDEEDHVDERPDLTPAGDSREEEKKDGDGERDEGDYELRYRRQTQTRRSAAD